MFIINFCTNTFRASLCLSSGEQRPCYCIWCVVLVLLDVVVSGCGALRCRMRAVLASYNAASHNNNMVKINFIYIYICPVTIHYQTIILCTVQDTDSVINMVKINFIYIYIYIYICPVTIHYQTTILCTVQGTDSVINKVKINYI